MFAAGPAQPTAVPAGPQQRRDAKLMAAGGRAQASDVESGDERVKARSERRAEEPGPRGAAKKGRAGSAGDPGTSASAAAEGSPAQREEPRAKDKSLGATSASSRLVGHSGGSTTVMGRSRLAQSTTSAVPPPIPGVNTGEASGSHA